MSAWATPVVPVPKRDGTNRLCGDYKITVIPVLQVDQYPLLNPTELMTTLSGSKHFSKLDLTLAYQQMLLDEDSARLVTVNTHQGLYECTRLPFGIASAPAVFQQAMDSVLQGIPGVVCYLDDILITGNTDEDHLRSLEMVLQQLQEHGVRLRRDKCRFFQCSVEYLGHRVDADGVHTSQSKMEAITGAPPPTNVTQPRSFLGLMNYYGKFAPILASLLHPLNELLRTGVPWKWTKKHQTAFDEAKKKVISAPVLTHYDPELLIHLACDACQYGIGAVISRVMPDGSERPID